MVNKEKIYLDNASTTIIGAEVLNAMMPVYTNVFGDPSSNNSFGIESEKLVSKARETIAESINAKSHEIYFTGSGSEANSWAIVGLANANRNKGNHIIVSSVEHTSVMEACRALEMDGFSVTYLGVDGNGFINFAELLRSIRPDTILISIISANHEIGTIQNIKAISQTAHEKNVIFHTDAIQLYGQMDLDVEDLGIDAMSLSAHKIHGPKGVGALYVSDKIKITPIIYGGVQERGRRGGTTNVAGVVGFGKAVEVVMRDMKINRRKTRTLSEYFVTKLQQSVQNIRIYANTHQKLPHIVSVMFIGVDGDSLMTKLDINGVAASFLPDRAHEKAKVSHIMKAMGLNPEDARCVVRFSFGKNNSFDELDKAIAILSKSVEELRELSSTYGMKIRKRKGDGNV